MTNKDEKITSFWLSDRPPLDDLAGIQEYLKPRSATELSGFFVTPPPLPPSAEVEEPRQLPLVDPVLDELLEVYGITPEEFVSSAVEEPELWDEDELERLHAVLSGDLAPQAISDIVFKHTSGATSRSSRKPPEPRQRVEEPDDFEDLGSDHLEVAELPPGGPEPLTDLPLGTIDVGEWWSNRRK